MISRITKKLQTLRHNNKKAFIPFLTAGDPDLRTTEKLVYALDAAGASLIELGMPFSDPMADGPVIQRASERALAKGTNLAKILALVKRVRRRTQIPILLMGYYNPILHYGLKKFAKDCSHSGVDGMLVVDLPPEESAPLRMALKGHAIDLIYLLAPTSNGHRIKLVNRYGSGFVYYVSLTGITGARHLDTGDVMRQLENIHKHIKLPINIGFGISKPEHVKALAPSADGVVVGSAIVSLIEKLGRKKNLPQVVGKFVRKLTQ